MRATSKWILSVSASALAAFGVHGAAMAETTEHATVCKPTGNSNRSGLFADSRGVRNATTASLEAVCPVVRVKQPLSTAFFDVKVDGEGPGTCTAYSFGQPDGGWRGQSATLSAPASGPWSLLLRIDPGRTPAGSYQSVVCRLASGTRLFGIRHPY
jgi:hypothetical protein